MCTPEDAYRCFRRTHLDALVLWPFVLDKAEQGPWEDATEWQSEFTLD